MTSGRNAWHVAVNGPGCLTIAVLIIVWEGAIRSGLLSFDYLPAPTDIVRGAIDLAADGLLLPDLLHTLGAILIGWSVAATLGVALGVLFGLSSRVRRFGLASVEIFRPMPGIALAPVALLLFGFSTQTELSIMILPAIWPVLVNTMGGLSGLHPRLSEVGRTLHLSGFDQLRRIILPAALPSIFIGLRVCLGLTLVLAVVAEIVGNPAGLGYGILREQQAMRPDFMFAYIVIIGLLGLALNGLLVAIAQHAFPYAVRPDGAPR